MSVFVEMLRLMEHSPNEDENRTTSRELMAEARAAAQLSRNEAERIVSSEKSRSDIKISVRESMTGDANVDISTLVEAKIREKAFSLAVDHLLIGGAVAEALALEDMESWEGEIIEDSYKILRDNLVEAAHDIIYNDDILAEDEDIEDIEDEDEDEDDEVKEDVDFFDQLKQRIMEEENIEEMSDTAKGITIGAIVGFLTPIRGAMIVGGIAGWVIANQRIVSKYCARKTKNPSDFAKCRSLGAAAIKQKIAEEKLKAKK